MTLCGIAASALVNAIWKGAPAGVLNADGTNRKSRASMARRAGAVVGLAVGVAVGLAVGFAVATVVGAAVGLAVGAAVGRVVGVDVGPGPGVEEAAALAAGGGLADAFVSGLRAGSPVGVDDASASEGIGLADADADVDGMASPVAAADPDATDAGAQPAAETTTSSRASNPRARATGIAAL